MTANRRAALFVLCAALADTAPGQSTPDAFTPYTTCSLPNGPSIVAAAPLAPGVNQRTVQTRRGNATVSLNEGRLITFAYPNEDLYANVKVESIPTGTYAQSRAALIDNFESILSFGDNARNDRLKPILNGFVIQGLDRIRLASGVLGFYLLLDDAAHTAVTISFENQQKSHFKTMQEYAALRDHFLDAYTACIREKQ